MARPINKTELLSLSNENFEKLIRLIDQYSDQNRVFAPGTMNRNIRDVLAHLHHWHLMMQEWYTLGMSGKKPEIPAPGYSWKTTPLLNQRIWEEYRYTDLDSIHEKLMASHALMTTLIQKHSDEDLFEKKKYAWTGTTSLGAYFIGATSSHYDWAIKLIKKGLK
jgi:hypothetical protein